jgi:hypothetical protein
MNDYAIAVFKEAVIIGLFTAVTGLFPMDKVNFFLLFTVGFLFQIVSELAGFNKAYCRHGAACKKNRESICQQ